MRLKMRLISSKKEISKQPLCWPHCHAPSVTPSRNNSFAITGETSITAGSQPAGSPCTFDGTTTHCNITSITLNSENLNVDSSNGPVNLYVSRDITMGGKPQLFTPKGPNQAIPGTSPFWAIQKTQRLRLALRIHLRYHRQYVRP